MDGLTGTQRAALERLLSERLGVPVRVATVQGLQRESAVWRCVVHAPGVGVPPSVIVRSAHADSRRGGLAPLRNERAALELLDRIGSTLAPRFLGADEDARLVVSEDLGEGPLLLDLLLGGSADEARRGVIAFARALGSLRAQTTGREQEFTALRASWGSAGDEQTGIVRLGRLAETWARVRAAAEKLGLPAPAGVGDEVEALSSMFAGDRDRWALSSGDAGPLNCKIVGGEARLFDFEYAAFRHGALDATALRYPYPTGAPPWLIPEEVAREMEQVYVDAAAPACPHLFDGTAYVRELAAACAAWTLLRMERLPMIESGPDRNRWPHVPPGWDGPLPERSRRHQLVATVQTAIEAARRADSLPALTRWLEAVVAALEERWPEAGSDAPLYPAFSQTAV